MIFASDRRTKFSGESFFCENCEKNLLANSIVHKIDPGHISTLMKLHVLYRSELNCLTFFKKDGSSF